MTKYRALTLATAVLFSVFVLAPPVTAGEPAGVMMKDGKVVMMQDGKTTGPIDHEMTMTNGLKVKPDGTMTMKDGTVMRMQEGQMVTMDGEMMEHGKGMERGKGMEHRKGMVHGKGMKMEGVDE